MTLKHFSYQFDAGPFTAKEDLSRSWKKGNCRRAVQYYFYKKYKIFLKPEQILCPAAYHKTGKFIFKKNQRINFDRLQEGDIIYAEKIRSKDGSKIDRSEKTFSCINDYLVSLHTALYDGEPDKEIWHATAIEGKSCYWPQKKFINFYRPLAVKRIITGKTR